VANKIRTGTAPIKNDALLPAEHGQKMTRRVIERILAWATVEFNLLDVKRLASVGLQRFPLVWYVTVSAQRRYISRRLLSFLCPRSPEPARGEA
jgi:hypothetical protein